MQNRIDYRQIAYLVHCDFNVAAVAVQKSSEGSFPFVFKKIYYYENEDRYHPKPQSRDIRELKGLFFQRDHSSQEVFTYVVSNEKEFLDSVLAHLKLKDEIEKQAIAKLQQQIDIHEKESSKINALIKSIGFQQELKLESKVSQGEIGFFASAQQPKSNVYLPSPFTFCNLLGHLFQRNDISQETECFKFGFKADKDSDEPSRMDHEKTYQQLLKNIGKLNGVDCTIACLEHKETQRIIPRAKWPKRIPAYIEYRFTIVVSDKEFFIESLLRATGLANVLPSQSSYAKEMQTNLSGVLPPAIFTVISQYAATTADEIFEILSSPEKADVFVKNSNFVR